MNKPNLKEDLAKQRAIEDEHLQRLRNGNNGAPSQTPKGTPDPANDLDNAIADTRKREDENIASLGKNNGRI